MPKDSETRPHPKHTSNSNYMQRPRNKEQERVLGFAKITPKDHKQFTKRSSPNASNSNSC